jgi:hypothetical protein
MDVQMLLYLVELTDCRVSCVNEKDFYDRYPYKESKNELYHMEKLKYLTLKVGSGEITAIGVNKLAIDFYEKHNSAR